MNRFVLPAVLAVLLPALCRAEEKTNSSISVRATGLVRVNPDEGYIVVGVRTVNDKSSEAVKENAKSMKTLLASVKEKGISEDSISTVQFSVDLDYKTVMEKGADGTSFAKQVPDGYVVINTVQITVCDVDKFGDIIDTLSAKGADSIRSIQFGSSKAKKAMSQARKEALAEAREKAKEMAEGLGVKLGKVIVATEEEGYRHQIVYSARAMEAGPKTPIAGGNLTYSVTVVVKWAIE